MLPGFRHIPGYLSPTAQRDLRDALREVARAAPFFRPTMPRTGRPFSVRMTNCGPLGWVSDTAGYRYQPTHPETGEPWPPMPDMLLDAWRELADYADAPEAALVNLYRDGARMSLHRDEDEPNTRAPVLSLSLGDTARFRVGGLTRRGPTASLRLESGDAVLLGGEARMAYHGIDRVLGGSSTLLDGGGRLNVTLRRVTVPTKT